MNGIYLSLGSNLGDRMKNLQEAVRLLHSEGLKIVKQSAVYETAPWGFTDQPSFLNAVVEVATTFNPHELLTLCLQTENRLGRKREMKWGPRIIDIDILFFGDVVLHEDQLAIPHPGIAARLFVLMPLCDIAPNEQHPETGLTFREILQRVPDDGSCQKTELVLGP